MEKTENTNIQSVNYNDLSLVSGGLIYNLTQWIRKKAGRGRDLWNTALALAAITWVPVGVLALIGGTLEGDPGSINFIEDFLIHVRFLLVVPFLILIERVVNNAFVKYIQNTDLIVDGPEQEKFNKFVKKLDRLSNSNIPELIILVVFYGAVILDWNNFSFIGPGRNYLVQADNSSLTTAGWYYVIISMPVYQLLLFRWLWRWIIWVYSVVKISRLKLQMDPLHADKMSGLNYLNMIPLTFSFILISLSMVLSAMVGVDIIYNGEILKTYFIPILIYVFILPILLYAPLLFFIPNLIHSKSEGIFKFGDLVRDHNKKYVDKWIKHNPAPKEDLLGSMDHSSLADINGSYYPIDNMKIVPVDFKLIILSFVFNVLPYIPLIFTYYSFKEFMELIMNTLIR